MTHWSDNEWSEEGLFSPERALYQFERHMARVARRKIKAMRGQSIHHIDGNRFNNDLSNLVVVERSENYGG